MNHRVNEIANEIRANVREIDSNARVILFGSRARGDEKPDSDWDILVLTGYPVDHNQEKKFRHHLYNLELKLEEPISLFVYSVDDWETQQRITPLYYNIKQEGIEL